MEEAARVALEDDSVGAASAEVFAAYRPSHAIGGADHPANIAEAASLAATATPEHTYPLADAIPQSLLDQGVLSSLQLESISLACQRHLTILPTTPPSRAAFFLGDGAGVGKGRQLAGIIFDNVARGRGRHLWFSSSSDLRVDACRDLGDVGLPGLTVIDGCQGLDKSACKGLGLSKEMQAGVLFSTYSTLVSATTGQKARGSSRLQQLIDWCGGTAFEGCLLFDECHKAKNWTGKEEGSSKVSFAVLELQRALPLARVVYCSATGASDLSNMAYMERLGLWGGFSPYKDFDSFVEGINRRGVGGLEMLAMEMKATGAYVCRGLSYADAEFELEQAPLSLAQRELFDRAAAFWAERLLPALLSAAKRTSAAVGVLTRAYWGAQQRFFKQLHVSLKLPTLIQRARRALHEGQSVVIGLQSTGEAALERALSADGNSLHSPASICEMMLKGFLLSSFPTKRVCDPKLRKELLRAEESLSRYTQSLVEARAAAATATGAAHTQASVELVQWHSLHRSAQLEVQQLQAAVAQQAAVEGQEDEASVIERAQLLAEVDALLLPPAALDLLIDQLGGKAAVAEMTGRKGRMVRSADGKRFEYEVRSKMEGSELELLNVSERNAFMEGRKFIAVISDAASTGISLQADQRVVNRRRRCHITLELPWSADKAVQQLGRSHRANQVSAPLYVLMSTELGGEARFASAVARRLQALGALTKGDRRAELGALDHFNYDTPWGKRALKALLARAYEGVDGGTSRAVVDALDKLGASDVREREKMEVKRFLNRLVGLKVDAQRLIFEVFSATHDGIIWAARRDGKYDEGITDVNGSSVTLEEEEKVLWTDPVTRFRTKSALVCIDRGIPFEAAVKKVADALGEGSALKLSERAGLRKGGPNAEDHEEWESEDDDGAEDDDGSESDSEDGSIEDEDDSNDDVESIVEDEQPAGMEEVRRCKNDVNEADEPDVALGTSGKESTNDGIVRMSIGARPSEEEVERDGRPSSEGVVSNLHHQGKHAKQKGPQAHDGFYRSRFQVQGKHIYVIALTKADSATRCMLSRPNTGPSPFIEEWAEVLRKYKKIEEKEAREGWTAAYEAALHSQIGGRLSHLQVLTGSLLPILPLLEELVRKFAPTLIRRDASVSAVRVQLEGRRLVGVRFPRSLMDELRLALMGWNSIRSMNGARITVDRTADIDSRALAKAMRPPVTMLSFFSATPRASSAPVVGSKVVREPSVPVVGFKAPTKNPNTSTTGGKCVGSRRSNNSIRGLNLPGAQSSPSLSRGDSHEVIDLLTEDAEGISNTESRRQALQETPKVEFFHRGDPARSTDLGKPTLPSMDFSATRLTPTHATPSHHSSVKDFSDLPCELQTTDRRKRKSVFEVLLNASKRST